MLQSDCFSLPLSLLMKGVPLLLFAFSVATGAVAQDWLARGRELADSGRTFEALAAFTEAKRKNSKDYRPYLHSGLLLLKAGRPKDAAIELNQVLSLKPDRIADAIVYAQALRQLKRPELALAALASWEDSPDVSADGLWLLAELYREQKKPAQALKMLQGLRKIKPQDAQVTLRLGEVQLTLSNARQAASAFRKVLQADPKHAAAFFGLGQAFKMTGEHEASREALLKAVEQDQQNPVYLQHLSAACLALGKLSEAVGYLEQASRLPAAPAQVLFELGNLYRRSGETQRAGDTLRRFQELHQAEESRKEREDKLWQLMNQGLKQLESGAISEAISSFRRVLDMDPEHWEAHLHLAKLSLTFGDTAAAYSYLKKMELLDPDSTEANYLLSFYHYEAKRYAEAFVYAEKVYKLRPGEPELRNLLGNLQLAIGNVRAALQEYEAAVQLAPERTDFRANYQHLKRKLDR